MTKTPKFLSLLIITAMILPFMTGCKNDTDIEESEYVYISDFFNVPGTFEYVHSI